MGMKVGTSFVCSECRHEKNGIRIGVGGGKVLCHECYQAKKAVPPKIGGK